MRRSFTPLILAMLGAAVSVPAVAQLALPSTGLPAVDGIAGAAGEVIGPTGERIGEAARDAGTRLLRLRESRISRLLRQNRDGIERDNAGHPARRGTLLLSGLDAGQIAAVRAAGFPILDSEAIEGLDITVVRTGLPAGMALADAQTLLAKLVGEDAVSADNLHFRSGSAPGGAILLTSTAAAVTDTPVGMIDGGAAARIELRAIRGFAEGAPLASDHGSAIASLLGSAGVRDIRAADVYGTDPAGGNALAIARALGWLTAGGAKIVTISLVGPRNGLLASAVAAAQRKGVTIVAAVGNDGPAAPPAFPASYRGVIAVTGVDSRNRAMIEAGRAEHLDYAAPGADIRAHDRRGRRVTLRGTSFAAPLVAARAAAVRGSGPGLVGRLDAEAIDLGRAGPDPLYGRGLLCGDCGR